MNAPPVPVLLFTHAGFGEGMLDAARAILGEIEGVDLLTNLGRSAPEVETELDRWIDEQEGPALVLTDISFGSCCQSARRVSRGRDDVGIIAGVNLPVLLSVLRTREHDDFPSLMTHLAERARDSVESYRGGLPA